MANYNLTNQAIEDSFQPLLQIDSGSSLRDGTGSLVDIINTTASYATSASYALTASYAENVSEPTWDNIQNKPSGLVSGSSQVILTDTTGNLGGNRITGSVANATSASYAISASYAVSASVEIIKEISSSYADHTQWSGIYNIPSGLVSSSAQVSDLTASLLETASVVDATITFTKGDGSTFDLTVDNVVNSTYSQNTITTGKNLHSLEIPKGTPLYFTGSGTSGNLVGIYPADAGNPSRMPAGGIAGETIAVGAEGVVLLDGYIGGVDTSLFGSGDEIFVAVGGGYTNSAPTGSALIQHLGNVEKSAVNGSGVIQMMGEYRQLPNLTSGYAWVGDGSGIPQAVSTASWDAQADLTSLNQFTASQEIYNTGINQYTSSTDARLNSIELETASLDGRVTSLENFSSSLDTNFVSETEFGIYTSSNDSKVNNLINATSSYATSTDVTNLSSSIAITDGTQNTRLTDLENFSSSLDATFATDAELASATQSLINSIATKLDTGSFNSYTQSTDIRITDLENFSSSLDTNFVSETEFGIYTSSNDSKVNSLISATGSYATTGSNTFIGNQDVNGIVSSTQNQSNTHYNPQILTDNVTIPTAQNGLIIGESSIAGDYIVEGNSEVYVFTPPPTAIDPTNFAKLNQDNTFAGTNTFNNSLSINGNQVFITGSSLDIYGTNLKISAANPINFSSATTFNGAILVNTALYQGSVSQITTTNGTVSNTKDSYIIDLVSGSDTSLNVDSMLGGVTRTVKLLVRQPNIGTGSLYLAGSVVNLYGTSNAVLTNNYLNITPQTSSYDYFEIKSMGSFIIVTNVEKNLILS